MSRTARRSITLVLAAGMIGLLVDPAAGVGAVPERQGSGPTGPPVAAPDTSGWIRGHAIPRVAPVGELSPASARPAPAFSFDAIARQGANWPADPTGALGEGFILTAVRASYALYDRTGRTMIGPNDLASLLEVAQGAEISEPRVVFDPYAGRFVLAYLVVDDAADRSWVYLVSIPDATALDPTTWCGARVVADRTARDGVQLAGDHLGLGADAQRVVVAMDMFDPPAEFHGATVLAFPKAQLYDCSRRVAFETFTGRETRSATGGPGRSLEPAVTVGQGRSLYLTSLEPGRPSFVVLWRLSGDPGEVSLRNVALRVPRLRPAPFGTQGDAEADDQDAWWDTGGLSISSTFADLDAGRVYAAHAVGKDLEPDLAGDHLESALRWYEIDPAGALGASRVLRVGAIGAPGTDAGWPSLATDVAGNLFVTYSRAGSLTGEHLSAWIAEIVPGSNIATTTMLRAGTARFDARPGPEPWGGSTAMSRDPADGMRVLAVNQVAVDDGSDPTRDWHQTVDLVSHVP